MSNCCGTSAPKEKKWGVKDCRARKCPELRKRENSPYPEEEQERCYALGGDHSMMPGTLSCCIKDLDNMPAEQFLRHITWSLHDTWEKKFSGNRKTPGPKNCPAICPYKISEEGKVRDRSNKADFYAMKNGLIWRCIFTGEVLGQGMSAYCPCHILDNPDQEKQIAALVEAIELHQPGTRCAGICPDGIKRAETMTNEGCPVCKIPIKDITVCPLWRIPAKLLPAPDNFRPVELEQEKPANSTPATVAQIPEKTETPADPQPESGRKEKKPSRKLTQEEKPAKGKREKKEPVDPICTACRERYKEPVLEWQCTFCKTEQVKFGRRGWTTTLQMGQVHLGDMVELGERVPNESEDVICTDPPYIKELWEEAYARLGELADRVLKPYGFLFTYAPQAHLDEIMEILGRSGNGTLRYFWIIQSLNSGPAMKAHKWNALCLHKPILVYQKVPDGSDIRGARRCFADVVRRGFKQKRFHPWQQSVHDLLGIIDRFMAPGERLLDPYAGTGTSLIAAQLLGMDWIGFEIDPKTHAIAVRELQQQPMDLFTFGGEEPEIFRPREVEEQKDTSRQAAIEAPAKKVRKEKKTETVEGEKEICTDFNIEISKCRIFTRNHCNGHAISHDEQERETRYGCYHSSVCLHHGTDSCAIHDVECDGKDNTRGCYIDHKIESPEELREYLEKYTSPKGPEEKTRKATTMHGVEKSSVQTEEPADKPDLCDSCSFLHCRVFDPTSPECRLIHSETEKQDSFIEEVHKAVPKKDPYTHNPGPQPIQQGTCGTCGHHKGHKTFHESCPRLGELLFKKGTKSAKALMEETQRERCEHWITKEEWAAGNEDPTKKAGITAVYYNGKDLSPSLGTCPDKCAYKNVKKSSCDFMDQQFLRMESCPTGVLQGDEASQKTQMENIARAMARLSSDLPSKERCQCNSCPDGVRRCGVSDEVCPFSKNPFDDMALCPMTNPRRVRQIRREHPVKFVSIDDALLPEICRDCTVSTCDHHDPVSEKCLLFHPESRRKDPNEEKIPNITWCSTIRNCTALDWEGGICTTTGKKVKEQTYCPTQHLVGKQPKKKPESERPNCGGKRPAINRCPDNCPDKSIEKEGGYPQGRCKQTGEKLREMQACPNDPPKSEKKPVKKPKPYTIYIKQSDGEHPFIVSCDSRNFGGTSNPCDTREEVIKRALATLDGFVHDIKKSSPTLAKKSLPVTIETTLFIDKTGLFNPSDFFDESGEPKKPELKKPARKSKKMEVPES